MTIAYEPLSDVLSITFGAAPIAQTQQQGVAAVSFDAAGAPVSVVIPNASTLLWEHGGQISITTPVKTVSTTVTTVTPVL